ncbi:MAG: hypothetical protein EHM14_08120 [Methanothrix sp.]|nr:MAG: hypothetical protein EHM14_08120 [Methanothrix sp.]
MSDADELGHTKSAGSELCLSCGLCCKGLLFNRAGLLPEEAAKAEELGLHCFPSGDGKFAFRLPCPWFQNERCSIYSARFDACQRYRCDLLKRLANGDLSVSEGKRIINKIKNDMSSISLKMESVVQTNSGSELPLDFRQRIVKTLDFLCRNPMICKDAGTFLREVESFLILLHDCIEKRAN